MGDEGHYQSKFLANTDTKLDKRDEIRIVLVGKTGVGKSATGNAILEPYGRFHSACGWNSQTKFSERKTAFINGRNVHVIDTPGIFDTMAATDAVVKEIHESLRLSYPGPHVFLLVIRACARFTVEEFIAFTMLKNILGEDVTKFMIIVFTWGDQLKKQNLTITDKVASAPPRVNEVLSEVSHRYVVFSNTGCERTKDLQVCKLLEVISELVKKNCSAYYRYQSSTAEHVKQ